MPDVSIHNGLLRRLYSVDQPAYVAHLLRLDTETRHDRFGMAVSDDWLANYATGCFGPRDLVYGFFTGGEIRAAGELRQLVKNPLAMTREAEAAFSVEHDWRRHGLGTLLMEKIVRAAQNRRDTSLHMMCLAQNKAMQGLARKFSADLEFGTDEVTGRLVGHHLSAASLIGEAVDDAAGLVQALLERGRRGRTAARRTA